MPVPTVAEVLKQSGWSQEKIDALDAQALSGITTYVSSVYQTAEQKEKAAQDLAVKAEADRKAQEAATEAAKAAQAAAELEHRNTQSFWTETFNPGIASWEAKVKEAETKAANASALAAFYETQNKAARESGFVPTDAPVFTPPVVEVVPPGQTRGPDGKFVAVTPGTPTFTDEQINQRIGSGLSNSVWALQEYQKLTGQFLPDPIDQLAQEATFQKLPFRDYVARKYDFQGKQRAAQEAAAKAHDDAIRTARDAEKDAEYKAKMEAQANEFAAKERKMAEQMSGNPDTILPPGSAKFTEVRRAQQAGERPDPTKMTPEARIKLTQENLRNRLQERQQQVA